MLNLKSYLVTNNSRYVSKSLFNLKFSVKQTKNKKYKYMLKINQ